MRLRLAPMPPLSGRAHWPWLRALACKNQAQRRAARAHPLPTRRRVAKLVKQGAGRTPSSAMVRAPAACGDFALGAARKLRRRLPSVGDCNEAQGSNGSADGGRTGQNTGTGQRLRGADTIFRPPGSRGPVLTQCSLTSMGLKARNFRDLTLGTRCDLGANSGAQLSHRARSKRLSNQCVSQRSQWGNRTKKVCRREVFEENPRCTPWFRWIGLSEALKHIAYSFGLFNQKVLVAARFHV